MIALFDRCSNWGRWGPDDELGTLNLITTGKRLEALAGVRSGRCTSIGRDLVTRGSRRSPPSAVHLMTYDGHEPTGANDALLLVPHGFEVTHMDALAHAYFAGSVYNGRAVAAAVPRDGIAFGSIHAARDGIVTRGVLLDVPAHRGRPFVAQEQPVHGWELAEIVEARGLTLEPGDAVCVYSGREAWQAAHPDRVYGPDPRPGLHVSCLPFLRDHDLAVLVWDMMDLAPNGYELPWAVHGSIFAYGVALLDNALLEPLTRACAEEQRWEFMLTIAPLPVVGGTGSPANPLALF